MYEHINNYISNTDNPDFKVRIEHLMLGQHFMHLVGITLGQINSGKVMASLQFLEKHQQQNGFLHGGVTATMADIVSGLAALTLVKKDVQVVTADLNISYLYPAVGQSIESIGWVYKRGKNLLFCEAEIYVIKEHNPQLVAKSRSIMASILP